MIQFTSNGKLLADRFISYAIIDTQSDENSTTIPSTFKQRNLGNLLVKELQEMGVDNAFIDDLGYVYASLPANTNKAVPVICFCSHMDTSPDCSGANVKPIIHSNYSGQDLVLPDDTSIVLKMENHPDLKNQLGNDIITASGTTLLGADNKAGVTAIMEAVKFLCANPNVKHGKISILFTPDEEIGRGVDHVDLKKVGADFGYTIDGETAGSIEDETFSADGAVLKVFGISAHPGFAKGKMQSAMKCLSEIIVALPIGKSPEGTSAKEGFVHPVHFMGNVEEAEAHFIIRDFEDDKLIELANTIKDIATEVIKKYPDVHFSLETKEQYRNMKKVLDQFPDVVEIGVEAIKRTGLIPKKRSIRGGTDGTRLSFMGLPCPNVFAGEHAFHGKEEWVSVQDMQKSAETIVQIASLWEERS